MTFENEILKRKYLREGETCWNDLCKRIFNIVAEDRPALAERIYDIMKDKKFSPAGSVLANLGTKLSLENCFVIPIEEDSIEGIFGCMQNMAKTFSWRGGCGFDISILRPKGAQVNNAARYSSGSVSFLPLFSDTVLSIGQGSNEKGEIVSRRGASIGTIDISHPDVINFIKCKSHPIEVFGEDVFKAIPSDVSGINLSVKITDEFMQAVLYDKEWDLIFNGKVYQTVKAKELFRLIAENAHASGDPGVLFWDRMKEFGTTEFCEEGKILSTNPCQPEFAPVLTPNGISTIGQIEIGDKIWSPSGWATVINKINRGVKDVYEYITERGAIACTREHKISENGKKVEIQYAKSIDACPESDETLRKNNYKIKEIKCLGEHTVYDITVDNEAHNYWTDGLLAFNCGEQPLSAWGACLTEDTLVMTNEGVRKIQDVKTHQYILSTDNTFRPFISVVPKGKKKVFKVYCSNRAALEGTEDHLLETIDGKFIPIKEALGKKIKVLMSKDAPTSIRKTDMEARLLGWIHGDGWCTENCFGISFNNQDGDFEIKDELLQAWNKFITDKPYKPMYDNEKSFQLQTTHKKIIKVIIDKYGIVPGKAHHKELPIIFYQWPDYKQIEFIRGLFTADGSIQGKNNREISFASNSEKLIYQIANYLRARGIQCKTYKTIFKTEKRKPQYRLSITKESSFKFMQIFGFLNSAKTDKFNNKHKDQNYFYKDWEYLEVTKIEELFEEKMVYDIIEIDQTNTFYAQGLAVHNCNLGSLNLLAYTTKKEFNWHQLKEDISSIIEFMDWLIDKTNHPLPQQTEKVKFLRKIGLGITGLGDSLALQGIKYSSQEARDFAREIMKSITLNAFAHSVELAKEYGSCPAMLLDKNVKAFLNQPFVRRFPKKLKQDIKKYGLRNTAVTSIAPTGSLSIILGNLTSGCEPLFEKEYYRTSRVTGETHKIVHPPAIERNIPLENYETASELDWKARVMMQAALQDWTTDSISSTVNLPADTTVKTMEDIYKEAWKAGLKGITVYRDKSKDVQVLNKDTICEERPNTITYHCAPKRPKELPCEIHHSVIRGEGYVSLVGILDDKPYEIFTGKTDLLYMPKSCKTGTIIKKGGGKYNLKIKIRKIETEYRDIANALMNDKEQAITRLISLGLRHGIFPKFLCEQLKKCGGSIVDFTTVLTRILSKYAKELKSIDKCPECSGTNLKFEGGCVSCKDCGWSRCN